MFFKFSEAEANANMLFEYVLTTVKLTDHILFVLTENLPTNSLFLTSKLPVEHFNLLDREHYTKNMLQEVYLNARAIIANMLFEITKNVLTDLLCSTFEILIEYRNCLAKECYTKKMIQDTTYLAV
ncbi:3911_t:CDS:1, partial [Racocetra persica]